MFPRGTVMSENILYSFVKDLGQLYANTHIEGIECHFVKIAQTFEAEAEKWIQKAVQLGTKATLSNPAIIDTLVLLLRMKQKYPSGISTGEMVKVFSDDKLKFFLPMILALREAFDSGNYAILAPFQGFFDATRQHMSMGMGSAPDVKADIELLDRQFRDELNRQVNRPYEEDAITPSKKKLNRGEKIGMLLSYLTKRFAEEISIAFEEGGQIDTIGLAENDMVLRDPKKVMETMFPNFPPYRVPSLAKQAKEMANTAIKTIDPKYYDYVFNEIRSKIMYVSADITPQEYNAFRYKSMLSLHTVDQGEFTETSGVNVSHSVWTQPENMLLLTLTLFFIGSQIR
jgi:hypothetical protein